MLLLLPVRYAGTTAWPLNGEEAGARLDERVIEVECNVHCRALGCGSLMVMCGPL